MGQQNNKTLVLNMKHVWRILRAPKNLRYEVEIWIFQCLLWSKATRCRFRISFGKLCNSPTTEKNVFWGLQVEINWGQILLFTRNRKNRSFFTVMFVKKTTNLPTKLLFTDGFQHLQIQVIPRLKKVAAAVDVGWMHGNLLPIRWTCNMYLYVDLPYLKLTQPLKIVGFPTTIFQGQS